MEKEIIKTFEIPSAENDSIKVDYYEKNMGNYKAHVFLCSFEKEADLKSYWKTVANRIALKFQSLIELEIERSNFYIGYFSQEPVSIELQNLIEQDPYCARKYVFDTKEQWNDKVGTIENHVFALPLNDLPISGRRNMISGVELQNFRGYRGRVSFDLTDKNGKPASFVLIYAPNGVGKTSFMDAIEFVLKGAVDRLVKLESKANTEEPIYHNYHCTDQKAYVKLFLKNSNDCTAESKMRPVPKYENGSDTKTDNRTCKIFNNRAIDWDMVLMPHDTIDTFITSNTPAQRFSNWTKIDKTISKTASTLKTTRKQLSVAEGNWNTAVYARDAKKTELDAKKKKEESVFRVIELIREYNSLALETKECLPMISVESDVSEYEKLMTEARSVMEEIQNTLKDFRTEEDLLQKWLQIGSENTDSAYRKYLVNVQIQRDKLNQLDLLKSRNSKSTQLSRIQEELNIREKHLEPYKDLETYGIENIYNEWDERNRLEQSISVLQAQIDKISALIAENTYKLERINHEIESFEDFRLLEKDAYSNLDNIKNLNNQLLLNQRISDSIIKQQKIAASDGWEFNPDILEEIAKNKSEKDKEEISGLILRIQQLKSDYEIAESTLHQVSADHIQQEKAASDLQSKAVSFLRQHKDSCKCPICHTEFVSWEMLLAKIQNIDADEQESYTLQLDGIKNKMNGIQEEYLQSLKIALEILNQCKVDIQRQNTNLDRTIRKGKEWFIINGFCQSTEDVDRVQIERFFCEKEIENNKALEEKIVLLQEKNENEVNRIKLDGERKVKQIQLNDYTQEQMRLFDTAARCEMDYKNGNYVKWKASFENYASKIQALIDEINAFDLLHPEIHFLSEDELQDEINETKIQLEAAQDFAKAYAPYYQNSNALKTREKICMDSLAAYEDQEGKLRRIINEEGIRDYIFSWKSTNKVYAQMVEEAERRQKEYIECKTQNDEMEEKLKQELEDYFSQGNANIIYQKIDPNNELTDMKFSLTYSDDDKPQLNYEMMRKTDSDKKGYTAELYLSTAQLNAVAFSSFFGRALTEKNLDIHSIFIDDPIGSFDDMNILGFADLIRSIIMHTDTQIIMTTHDSKIYHIMQRKLDSRYHSSRFYRLPQDLVIEEIYDPEE